MEKCRGLCIPCRLTAFEDGRCGGASVFDADAQEEYDDEEEEMRRVLPVDIFFDRQYIGGAECLRQAD